ncbi:hypothetical protein Tco_1036689 [Tanacetum coccineum]
MIVRSSRVRWDPLEDVQAMLADRAERKIEINADALFPYLQHQASAFAPNPDGDGIEERHHIVPFEELNGVPIALVARIQASRPKLNNGQNLTIPQQRRQKLDAGLVKTSHGSEIIQSLRQNTNLLYCAWERREELGGCYRSFHTLNRLGRLEHDLSEVYGAERIFFLYFYFIESRDHILKGDIELHFIPTQYQLANIFTKPLDEPTFKRLIVELGMLNVDSKLEASVLTEENRGFSDFMQN